MRRFLVVLCGITLPFLTSCSEYTDYVTPKYSVVVEYCNETYSPITIEFVANNHWELGLDLDHGVAATSRPRRVCVVRLRICVVATSSRCTIAQSRSAIRATCSLRCYARCERWAWSVKYWNYKYE